MRTEEEEREEEGSEENHSGWPLTETDALALLARRRTLCLCCCRVLLNSQRPVSSEQGGSSREAAGSATSPESVRLIHGEAFVCTLASWYERHSVQERLLPCPEDEDTDANDCSPGGEVGDRQRGQRHLRRLLDGPPASSWEAKRPIPAAFTEAEAAVPLPGRVGRPATCPGCHGIGYSGCRRCRRKGHVTCPGCHGGGGGGGGGDSHRCFVCASRGSVRCPACSGRVSGVECSRCCGAGRLVARRWLQASWTVTIDSALLTAAGLPTGLLAEAAGRPVYRQVAPRVALSEARFPLGLVLAAEVLANRHLAAEDDDANCRLLLQRLTVRLVPVCACEFRSGRRLFVYGQDRRLHWEKRAEPPPRSAAACTLL